MSPRYRSSKAPGYVVMRDARTGRPVRIPVGVIPEVFRPETWYENAYWMYSGALNREDIEEFFSKEKQEIRADFAHKLATYILNFVQNLAAAVWLVDPNRDEYLEFMKPCIEKLSALKRRARCRKDIMEMIYICLDYGMDPF